MGTFENMAKDSGSPSAGKAWPGSRAHEEAPVKCRRRHLRLPLELPVTVERLDDSGHVLGGTVQNLSDSGLLLMAAEPLAPGSTIAVSVASSTGELSLAGKVIWSRRISPDQAQSGILFRPSPGHGFARRLFIQEFVRMR